MPLSQTIQQQNPSSIVQSNPVFFQVDDPSSFEQQRPIAKSGSTIIEKK